MKNPFAMSPATPQAAGQDKTIYSVQALRFIAAALVVASHIRSDYDLPSFGTAGVDIFFVISGFIIHYVTRSGAPQFFTRRLIRILPLYWLGTFGLAVLALVVPSILNNVDFSVGVLLKSLFFIPVWNEAFQYHLPLLMLGWSLNYEILFYLLYFVALSISHKHRLVITSVMLLALTQIHPFVAPESALSFWSDAYIVEFIYGMVLAALMGNPQAIEKCRLPISVSVVALGVFCWALLPSTGFVTTEMSLHKWTRVLVIGLPATLLVVLTLATEQSMRRLPGQIKSGINFLGELSYPTYIFHVYVMGLLKRTGFLEQGILVYSAVVTIATLVLSAVVFLFYEQPVRNYLSKHLLPRKTAKPQATPPNVLPA